MSADGDLRMISAMFAEWRPELGCSVPFTAYQEYTVRRLRCEADTTHDLGRFEALMWFIDGYSRRRTPFRAPFGARQVRWLLESNDTGMETRPLPRVVEWFRRRDAALPNPYDGQHAYLDVAFWWSVGKALEMNVEHVLVPDVFVAVLSAPIWGAGGPFPVNEFLQRFAMALPAWRLETEALRLGAYMSILSEPQGVHYSLFFPPDVLDAIAALSPAAVALADAPRLAKRLKARAEESRRYRREHKRLRSGVEDVSASLLGQDWMAQAWRPPRPSAPPAPARVKSSPVSAPVRVVGPINSRSGLGQATRLSIRALEAVGVPVETVDFMMENPAPRSGYHASVTPAPAPFAINLLHLNAESIPLTAAYMSPETFRNAYNIGYFFWELPTPASCHLLALEQLEEVWVSSEYNRATYAPHAAGEVRKMGMAVELADTSSLDAREVVRRAYGLPQNAVVFVTTLDSYSFMSRKNPSAVLRAFRAAFPSGGEDVRLVVKTHNLLANLGEARAEALRNEVLSLCASDPRILLINETLPFRDVLSLKAASDVYVSLHRAEGWGFGMLESMQLGLPSIATAFSGNLEFCTEETAWLIPWTRRYLKPGDYIFYTPGDYWAEPDLAAAVGAMREAAADPVATRAKGAAARAFVEARFSPAAVGARYLERLRAIGAAAGRSSPTSGGTSGNGG